VASVVVKYREDQARDDHGRFADEGGGGHYTAAQQQQLRDLMGSTSRRQAAGTLPKGVRSDAKLDGEAVPVDRITDFLRQMVGGFLTEKTVNGFILEHGEEFKSPDAPPSIKLMTPKMCYENAAKNSRSMWGEFGYAEGYVHPPGLIPIQHAWNYDLKTGRVVDFTLGWMPKAAYFGVKIPEEALRKELADSKVYGALEKSYRPSELVRNWGKT